MLFLATFRLEQTHYMGATILGDQEIRLIKAEYASEAETKLCRELERNDPYGCSVSVEDLEITACIE